MRRQGKVRKQPKSEYLEHQFEATGLNELRVFKVGLFEILFTQLADYLQ